jgi:hypothetical protein
MSTYSDIPSCFTNIIGLRGTCEEAVSTSGLWANDVGISEDQLNEIVTSDFINGRDLFNKKLEHSIIVITSKVYASFASKFKAFSQIENERIGFFKDNLSYINTQAGYLYGQHITLTNYDSFLDLFVSQLNIQVDISGTYDIYVFDLMQNKLIDTFQIDAIAGEISATFPAKKYLSGREKLDLFIGYNPTGARYNDASSKRGGSCFSCGGGSYANEYVRATGARILVAGDKIVSGVESITGTGGLSIVYSLSCNHREWICSSSAVLAIPLYYYLAFEIMDFALHNSPNDRLNNTVWLNKDLIEQRRKEYYDRFNQSFTDTMQNISLPSDSKCFICKQPIRYATMLP